MREKQYKSELLSAQLQLYNRLLLETIEDGLSYEDFIDSYAERIVHVHLKDYVISDKPLKNSTVIKSLTHGDVYKSKGGKCLTACEIGTGDVNYPEISRKLKKIQYNGCYSLEFDTIPSDDEISRVLKNITKYFGE